MKILYVGPLWCGGTCLQRMDAMEQLGHKIVPIDTESEDVRKRQNKLIHRVAKKIFGPKDLANTNKRIIEAVKNESFDVIWVDKGITIKPETLLDIKKISPKSTLVHYNPDDPFGALRGGWRTFIRCARLYDVHFVPRQENLVEYEKLGCKHMYRFYFSYDRDFHRPVPITSVDRLRFGGEVGFIGDYERERAEAIIYLAENSIPVRVWGPNWNRKCKLSHPNVKIEGRPLWGDEYVKAICCFDINLGFLRRINRDLQTSRSVEIPACGGFMLAERTDEHLELFEEDKEAVFFSSNEELLEKIRYYLVHPEHRKAIAERGRQRCLKSGYSNHDRLREMLKIVEQIKDKKQ